MYRSGQVYVKQGTDYVVYDHSFPSYADGIVVPHCLYDEARNTGYMTLGTSKDTSEFACESIALWWEREICWHYLWADMVILRCDGGGSNSSRSWLMKQDFQDLATRIGLPVQIQHYPPYCSKYNRIEHRLFPHITRQWDGVIFQSYEMVRALTEQTRTTTGLAVQALIHDKEYLTGRQADPEKVENLKMVRDETLGKWNYTFYPQT
jgi:hypothetical protein